MSDAARTCFVSRCLALPVNGSLFCVVHHVVVKRQPGDVPIRCYACAKLIRIGQWWAVRREGAIHVTPFCLSVKRDDWVPSVLDPGARELELAVEAVG